MNNRYRTLIWVFAIALLAPASAPESSAAPGPSRASIYEITHLYSNVSFSITKIFFKEEGGFRDYSGEIFYDPEHPERSRVSMTVQAASIDTRVEGRDKVLRSDDFFDVAGYPTLTFKSTSVSARPGDMLDVTGDLTIRGVTKRITVTAHFLGIRSMPGWGEFAGFDTVFTIDRTDFGVNGSRWSGGNLILSKEVTIHLALGGLKPGSK
jgi:polyisoprenoid-binding protein YceI